MCNLLKCKLNNAVLFQIAASFGNKIFIFEPEPISFKSNETNKV